MAKTIILLVLLFIKTSMCKPSAIKKVEDDGNMIFTVELREHEDVLIQPSFGIELPLKYLTVETKPIFFSYQKDANDYHLGRNILLVIPSLMFGFLSDSEAKWAGIGAFIFYTPLLLSNFEFKVPIVRNHLGICIGNDVDLFSFTEMKNVSIDTKAAIEAGTFKNGIGIQLIKSWNPQYANKQGYNLGAYFFFRVK